MKALGCLLVGMSALAAGCQMETYRAQPLGNVEYATAFAAARTVFAQYFSIASADEATGVITARPKPMAGTQDRLLATSAARQIARLRVLRGGDGVSVEVRVETQRQDVQASRQMQPITADNERPSQTPAQETAATTPEQNQAWMSAGRDSSVETAIIRDLLARLEKP